MRHAARPWPLPFSNPGSTTALCFQILWSVRKRLELENFQSGQESCLYVFTVRRLNRPTDTKTLGWRASAKLSPITVESFHIRHQWPASCRGRLFIVVPPSEIWPFSTTVRTTRTTNSVIHVSSAQTTLLEETSMTTDHGYRCCYDNIVSLCDV